jgi:hypothetical protein
VLAALCRFAALLVGGGHWDQSAASLNTKLTCRATSISWSDNK